MNQLLKLLISSAILGLASLSPLNALAQYQKPEPAFAGQTEAPKITSSSTFQLQTITDELDGPWSLAFLPDGNFLIAESQGRLRIVTPDGVISAPITGIPGVKTVAAQGFHDVVLDPDFETNRNIYFTYFAPPEGEAPANWPITHYYEDVWTKSLAERRLLDLGTERIGKARLSDDSRQLEDLEVLYEGGVERRIVFAPDGTMLITGADAFRFYDSELDGVERDFVDEPDITRNFSGRVIRINSDGTIPADNPWLSRATVSKETYAHGLKDPEGAAIHPETGELWVIDHGPQGGDEINIIKPGFDYGWPNVTYGVQYDARQLDGRTNVAVGTGLTSLPGVEEPRYFWIPSIAPSGMSFYTGDLFPEWQGNLFVGAMAGQALIRLELDGDNIVGEERLLEDMGTRIREVREGPEGAIYIFGGNSLMRLVPGE